MKMIGHKALITALMVFVLAMCGCKGKTEAEETPEAEIQTEESVSGGEAYRNDFAGAWTDKSTGAMLDIWRSEDGVFHALACIKSSDTEVSYWSFTAPAEDGKLVYTDCERIDAVYGSNGQISETTVYERGIGSVEFSGDDLVWHDATDNAGDGLVFVYEGGY